MKRDQCSYNAIATTCPLEYGSAVYQAQALYQLIDPWTIFQDDDLCNVAQARKANPVKKQTNKKRFTLSSTLKSDSKLIVFPNPTTGQFSLTINSVENTETGRVELINTIGQIVIAKNEIAFINNTANVYIANIPAGIYKLKVSTNTAIYLSSIVITK